MSQKITAEAKHLQEELDTLLAQPSSPEREQKLKAWREKLFRTMSRRKA